MNPLLAERRRLLAYLAAWGLLGILLALLLVLTGRFAWLDALAMAVPLVAAYSFICLGAVWVCRAAPLRMSSLLQAAGAQVAAALISAALWLFLSRGWAALLDRTELFRTMTERQVQAAPLLLRTGLLFYTLHA